MRILRIDPDSICRSEPAAFRRLEKLCNSCEAQAVCTLDLARDATDPIRQDWREYCPNAATLNMLSAVESCYWH
jgi:hypothetical protein